MALISLRKTPEPGLIRSFSMLVVEDELVSEILIRKECNPLLSKTEFKTKMVFEKTCDAGWALVETQRFDFYVIDWLTPGTLKGPELCLKILGKYPEAKIVFYTSEQEDRIDSTGLCGRVIVIHKDPKQLSAALEDRLKEFKEAPYQRKNSANANKE